MLAIERLAAHTLPTRNLRKRSIMGDDLNLPQANWKGCGEKGRGGDALFGNISSQT